ncbi:hypothetical protein ABW19_dt0205259 [Dactylella cylindrospora]|nr:hypothetical protein ABW19_dt0205259 [Dactylella cylindrospora]
MTSHTHVQIDSESVGNSAPSGLGSTCRSRACDLTSGRSNLQSLFPSMHILSTLPGIEDKSRFSNIKDTGFQYDVGIVSHKTMHIGQGSQFSVSLILPCCSGNPLIRKSVLASLIRSKPDQKAREKLQKAVFLELRALSFRPIHGHQNIVKLFDIGWELDPEDSSLRWPVLIMEYADRGSLKDFLQGERHLSPQKKFKICLDVSKGLEALHRCGIIHGDLKTDNVLVFTNPSSESGLADQFIAKLGDFGASIADNGELSRLAYTSRPWNAPEYLEVLDGEGLKRTDVYSLGLLIWAVIIDGKNPFTDLKKVSALLPQDSFYPSLEKLKSGDNGIQLLSLAQECVLDVVEECFHQNVCGVLDSTIQFDSCKRNLDKAIRSLEDCLIGGSSTFHRASFGDTMALSEGTWSSLSQTRLKGKNKEFLLIYLPN